MKPKDLMHIAKLGFEKVRLLFEPVEFSIQKFISNYQRFDISIFHEYTKPPSGGGNQLLKALWNEFNRRGYQLENNSISATTKACLFNSFNFNFHRLQKFYRMGCKMVHRVDGPIATYRGIDDGTDQKIWEINKLLADVTIFQSNFSLSKHKELGFDFKSPVVIPNAADPAIFNDRGNYPFHKNLKIRLISVSWSDNPNKGLTVYKWLDQNLDWSRFSYRFVGRINTSFRNIQKIAPVNSEKLSSYLRQSHIFITASKNDPCSNSLIEALSCGLPAIYYNSGGHGEIVGDAGFSFDMAEEVPELIERLILEYKARKKMISVPEINTIADYYLKILLEN